MVGGVTIGAGPTGAAGGGCGGAAGGVMEGGFVTGGGVTGGLEVGGVVDGGAAGGFVTGGLLSPGDGAGPAPVAPVNCPDPSGGSSVPLSATDVTGASSALAFRADAVAGFLPTGNALALCSASRSAPVRLSFEANLFGSSFSA